MKRLSDIFQICSYLLSSVMIGTQQSIVYMDEHTGAIGGILGIATFLLNWYYQAKRAKFDRKK